MRTKSIPWKHVLAMLAVALAIFVGWRLATFPVAGSDEPESAWRQRKVVDRLPDLDVVDPSLDVSVVRAPIADATTFSRRVRSGWFARHDLALEARCIDADGNPLAGVEVVAAQAGLESSGESGPDGRVAISRNVAWIDCSLSIEALVFGKRRRHTDLFDEGETQVQLVARRDGYTPATSWVQLRLGETVQAGEIVLLRAGTVEGRVVDAAGAPVADAVVGVGRRDDGPRRPNASWTRGVDGETDASGRFRIDDAPAGFVTVGARDSAGRKGSVRDVEVRAGSSTAVEIVVAAAPIAAAIEGRVLSADGLPVAGAMVVVRGDEPQRRLSRITTDRVGAFRCELADGRHASIAAWDPTGAHGEMQVEDVAAGTSDLILQLGAARTIELDVVRADGEPVAGFHVSVRSLRAEDDPEEDQWRAILGEVDLPGSTAYSSASVEPGRAGPHRISVPSGPFAVVVRSPGTHAQTLGPFATAPDVLRVVLESAPLLRGRVLRDGAPVAGAHVFACTPIAPGRLLMQNGFPKNDAEFRREVSADAEGRFTLVSDLSPGTWLRAEAPGSAAVETAPLAIDGRAPDEIVIELTRGGDLEGEVIVDPGRDPAGIVVGISRGDGFARTQRTDRHGRFRFDHLIPGAWFVHEHEGEIQPRSSTFSWDVLDSVFDLPTTANVVEGRTTRLILDVREPPPLQLLGRAHAGGRALAGWTATLVAAERSSRTLSRERATSRVAADGGFELVVRERGAYGLTLTDPSLPTGARTIDDTLTINGDATSWSCEFATGTLEGNAPPSASGLQHVARTSTGALVATAIVVGSDGRFRVEAVPAGPGSIRREPQRGARAEPTDAPALRNVDVPIGGTAHVELP